MAQISTDNISKTYNGYVIFEDVALSLEKGGKYALIGRNGAGKSTLFRILAGLESPDSGNVNVAGGQKTAYLGQTIPEPAGETVKEELLTNFTHLFELYEEIKRVSARMGADESAVREYERLWDSYEHQGGLKYETEIKRVLTGLNLKDIEDRKTEVLSGGERMRLSLAKILLEDADIMLLDEPTNHLDMDSVKWLGEFIGRSRATVLMISHDRYLIDMVVRGIYEMDNGGLKYYKGGYGDFERVKKSEYEHSLRSYQARMKKINKLEEYVRKYKSGNRATMAKSRENALSRIEPAERPSSFDYSLHLDIKSASDSGNDVLRVEGLDVMGFFTVDGLLLRKGDRLGIAGPNGSGKTSFLRSIYREEPGVRWGHNVKIAYFDQTLSLNEEDITLTGYLNRYHDLDEFEGREILGKYHFKGDDAFKVIATLSGGERSRFKLLTLTLQRPNVIILDEPTNHLDMDFISVLEEGLRRFDGTLLMVSHDRYFLKNVCKKYMRIDRGGCLFSDDISVFDGAEPLSSGAASSNGESREYSKTKREKNSEKKRLERIEKVEEEINRLESDLAAVDREMLSTEDLDKLQQFHDKRERISHLIDGYLDEWEELHG